jgi:hypothetical protein
MLPRVLPADEPWLAKAAVGLDGILRLSGALLDGQSEIEGF